MTYDTWVTATRARVPGLSGRLTRLRLLLPAGGPPRGAGLRSRARPRARADGACGRRRRRNREAGPASRDASGRSAGRARSRVSRRAGSWPFGERAPRVTALATTGEDVGDVEVELRGGPHDLVGGLGGQDADDPASSGLSTWRSWSSRIWSSRPAVMLADLPGGPVWQQVGDQRGDASHRPVSCSPGHPAGAFDDSILASMSTADSGSRRSRRMPRRAAGPWCCRISAGSLPSSRAVWSFEVSGRRMPWARRVALRPAVSLSKATRMPVRSRSAAWLMQGGLLAGQGGAAGGEPGVPAGVGEGDGDGVERSFHDDGDGCPGEGRAGAVQPEQQAAFPVSGGLGAVEVFRHVRPGAGVGASDEPGEHAAPSWTGSMTRSRNLSMRVPREDGLASPAAWISRSSWPRLRR